ncbi:phosphonoacetaldehyde hydrolase [Oceanidesulfovibrio marinus]|uniref:Phosphonoacetaldehyde hydrolase n=1 Tax=Oceanidesulfovibrio marinus TaxID=370038 RepID=A0ABX6NGT9_9BACT|nr:phosphonoacetaldehyde hydrolase [Oceanidesulfovibrio marinus]QJT09843.1 phosphonoacetaldehyde hydrolase [Oceanidesulfovibrio marinus]
MNNCSCSPLKAVVLDWAGTSVDYGCLGPVMAFQEVFRSRFIEPTVEEVRVHMGMDKLEHFKAISAMPRIRKLWAAIFGKEPAEADFDAMNRHFEEVRTNTLHEHSQLVPGLIDTVSALRGMGLRIGSTTGYNARVADLIRSEAARHGYWPDCLVSSSDVPSGRPNPWMCFRNAMELGTYPMSAMVKVGDTAFDVLEGLNAGMWAVAVTTSGNEMGLSLDEIQAMDSAEVTRRQRSIRRRMESIGAHFVITDIQELVPVLEKINQLLNEGISPDDYLAWLQAVRAEHNNTTETNVCSPSLRARKWPQARSS